MTLGEAHSAAVSGRSSGGDSAGRKRGMALREAEHVTSMPSYMKCNWLWGNPPTLM